MYLKYGDYKHKEGEVSLSIDERIIEDDQNNKMGVEETWTITGLILPDDGAADPVASLQTNISKLQTAYRVNGKNICLYINDSTKTTHEINSSQAIGGVRVQSIRFPESSGSELVTGRSYVITVKAEVFSSAGGTGSSAISKTEVITQQGTGGPRYVWRETRNGPAVRQMVSLHTTVRIQQTGTTITVGGPLIPPPLMSDFELLERRSIATSYDSSTLKHTVNYSYQFETYSGII